MDANALINSAIANEKLVVKSTAKELTAALRRRMDAFKTFSDKEHFHATQQLAWAIYRLFKVEAFDIVNTSEGFPFEIFEHLYRTNSEWPPFHQPLYPSGHRLHDAAREFAEYANMIRTAEPDDDED